MGANTSNDPIDAAQIQLGTPILPTDTPGSLQRAVDLLNHIYSQTMPTLCCWPQGDDVADLPFVKTDTSSAWVDWFVIPAHIPNGFQTISLLVRSARVTGNTTQIRLSSSVDAGLAAATTITPNTAGALVPTTQTASGTITPGDNTLKVQVFGNNLGSAAIDAVVVSLDGFAL